MTEHARDGGDELDLATIARDDQLLDALGRGEPGPADDDVAAALAAWRADLDGDDEQRLLRAATQPAAPATAFGPTPVGRGVLRLAAAVLAVLALATGLGVGSRTAGPTSPLWSLTRVLHPEQAQVRGVEHDLALARAALTAGRPDEARDLVARARRDVAGVDDPATAARLRADLDEVDRLLAALVSAPTPSPAAPTPDAPTPNAPTGAAPTNGSAPVPEPAPATPAPAPTSDAPGLPDLLPSLPPLLPSSGRTGTAPGLPLPSLPGLPLPTLVPLG
ncbi:anti-sigma-D factor RsdA [Micromonospora krabiensis]|uniref:Anti-sigma-D factor RsdA to sigma factor binding region n=1 Tax=Micromonospora krabiensis TaxID=307121 RepID=A0A1C3N2V1_9ACTN|nr:anti-sigma-D factor RsdA [Micromonospora krabiensis]SBV26904.1 Anti-sigma-D factor RsdA to sigma factor binding region [Micromonospora krabiensis]